MTDERALLRGKAGTQVLLKVKDADRCDARCAGDADQRQRRCSSSLCGVGVLRGG